MPRSLRGRVDGAPARETPRGPHDDSRDVAFVELTPDELQLGLPPGQLLRVDRARKPANGDLAWVELVRQGSTQRLVRAYTFTDGWVTLTVPDGRAPAVMRRRGELLVLGVVVETVPSDASAGPSDGPAPVS